MRAGEQINHTEVFDSHGWICHLCENKIDPRATRDDWMRVTLDHLIPLSRGGTHTRDNVKPAHWKCNMDRGNDLLPDNVS